MTTRTGSSQKKWNSQWGQICGDLQPVLFIGHGSPMLTLMQNEFTGTLNQLGQEILNHKKPDAILCVSAHWQTSQTWITGMNHPRQVYDMYGFPQALYDFKYPSAGSTEIALKIKSHLLNKNYLTNLTSELQSEPWGIDHGSWSILAHLFPQANIPVLQLSLDRQKNEKQHAELAAQLQELRRDNILIIGSGNIVHNLREMDWNPDAPPSKETLAFDQWVHANMSNQNFTAFITDWKKAPANDYAVPTEEHYLPFIYALGAAGAFDLPPQKTPDQVTHFELITDQYQHASLSHRSYLFY